MTEPKVLVGDLFSSQAQTLVNTVNCVGVMGKGVAKDHWRSVSRLADIVNGLEYLREHYKDWGITSLALPPLGCGQGQLEWRIVGPTLYRCLRTFDIPVEMYAHPTGRLRSSSRRASSRVPRARQRPETRAGA